MYRFKLVVGIVFFAASSGTGFTQSQYAQAGGSSLLDGFAVPSAEAELSASQTAQLKQRIVEPGTVVRAGTVVAQLDDDVQILRVRVAEHRAAAKHALELARVNVETAQREFDRLTALDGQASVSRKELNDARDELVSTQLALEEVQYDLEQAELDAALQRAIRDEFLLRAPFNGVVMDYQRDVGETIEEGDPIVTVIKLDPLTIQIDCPLKRALALSVGTQATVLPAIPDLEQRIGKVTYVSAKADEGSQTVRVHIDVPNPKNTWPGGVRVKVRFDESIARASIPSSPVVGPNVAEGR